MTGCAVEVFRRSVEEREREAWSCGREGERERERGEREGIHA